MNRIAQAFEASQWRLTTSVLHGDVSCLARLLFMIPEARWDGIALDVIDRAVAAQDHRMRTRKAHRYGNGSIMAAARMYTNTPLPAEPTFDNPKYCRAMTCALKHILALAEAQEETGA